MKRLAPGLYESGTTIIEQDVEGHWGRRTDWWIRRNGWTTAESVDGPYRTLADAKADL